LVSERVVQKRPEAGYGGRVAGGFVGVLKHVKRVGEADRVVTVQLYAYQPFWGVVGGQRRPVPFGPLGESVSELEESKQGICE